MTNGSHSSGKHLTRVRRACRTHLLEWFAAQRRTLPWRSRRTPYRVWVAEIMLQQTRTDQALPYYRRFLETFPSLRALADASTGEVLKAWEGLGYYARARRMQETARLLVSERRGRFPRSYEELRALPGVGDYTAAAIASIAMGQDAAVVDGNVMRVLSRVFAVGANLDTAAGKRELRGLADAILTRGRAGKHNEAMMELGALICSPRSPQCVLCPLERVCMACAEQRQEEYPIHKQRRPVPHKVVGAAVLEDSRGRILLAQRHETDMLGGLWEFPGGKQEPGESIRACIARELREELGVDVHVGERVTVVSHAYSHFTMDLHAYRARITAGRPRPVDCADFVWVPVSRLRDYPMSRADVLIAETVMEKAVGA